MLMMSLDAEFNLTLSTAIAPHSRSTALKKSESFKKLSDFLLDNSVISSKIS